MEMQRLCAILPCMWSYEIEMSVVTVALVLAVYMY